MSSCPLEFVDGAFRARLPSGALLPLRKGGEMVREFLGGWSPGRLYAGAGTTRCLALRHEDGRDAVWYLDAELNFQTNDFARLPPATAAALAGVARADLAVLWDRLLCRPTAALDTAEPDLALDPLTRALATEAAALPAPPLVAVVLDGSAQGMVDLGGAARTIRFARAQATLGADYVDLAAAALNDGVLRLASPFSGETLATDAAVLLKFGVYAYRFHDPAADLVFYAVAGAWRTQLLALYVPACGVVLYARPLDRQWLDEWLGQPLPAAFAGHLLRHAEALHAYLAAPARRLALIYHQEHLGHHLWNELTGLAAMLQRVPAERIPAVFMLDAAASEMWGRLDVLFPVLQGRVERGVRNGAQLTERAYRDALTLLRPCTTFVSRALAARIIAVNEAEAAGAAETYAGLRAEGYRIVMLGLRVENRTIVDQEDFFRALIGFLHARVPRLAVVIDGHNAAPGAAIYRSHGEPRASRPPAQVEREMLAGLRAAFAETPGVRILDTIGAPIGASLFWCNRAAFFVTPWGAGLAKYRWICNRPGVVTAGPTFLRRSGQDTVHLYDSPSFMEAPTALLLTGPDDAEDAPEAPMLVGLPTPDRQNYRLSFPAAFALAARLLDAAAG